MDEGKEPAELTEPTGPTAPAVEEPGQDLDWIAEPGPRRRPSLREARIGWFGMIGLLVLVAGAGLGFASLGGWFGLALIVVLVVAMLGLMYVWSALPPDPER